MNIQFRPMHTRDIAVGLPSIRDRLAYSSEEMALLETLWRQCLQSGAADAAVMEDPTAPAGRRLIWVCFRIFVDEKYTGKLLTTPEPTVGKCVLDDWKAGNSPILTADEIKRRNSRSGLTTLILHSGAPNYAQTPEILQMLSSKVVDFTLYHASGYRLNEFLIESYTPMTSAWSEGSGLLLRTDRSQEVPVDSGNPARRNQLRQLYGMNRAEAGERPGSVSSSLFHYSPPVFFFDPLEQVMLLHALTDDSYDGLANMLNIATVTVNKRWQTIYDKVASSPRVDELLPGCRRIGPDEESRENGTNHDTGRPQSQRKRQLLAYIRHHMEELRPANPDLMLPSPNRFSYTTF